MKKRVSFLVFFCCLLVFTGCDKKPTEPSIPSLVTAEDLAGSYDGVLEGVMVSDVNTTGDPDTHVIIDIDLLHTVTLTDLGGVVLSIESSVIPKTRALVIGLSSVAINLEFIEFEDLTSFPQNHEINSLKVKNIIFVKYENEWVFVLQIARIGFAGDSDLDGVYVYQYVSYPSSIAQMSESDATTYVNNILKLASAAQR